MTKFIAAFKGFWGRDELILLAVNLGLHIILQVVALQFMPLPYYSELSLHDGQIYYAVSENLLPAAPISLIHWHKRILLSLLVAVFFYWNRHLGFLAVNFLATSLSAVFFYKTTRSYSPRAFWLALFYSCLPFLVFATHHSLTEPLMLLFTFAGYYYYRQSRLGLAALFLALALLSKEVAVVFWGAIILVEIIKHSWRRVALLSIALIPTLIFITIYAWRWQDPYWFFRSSLVSPIPGFLYTLQTLLVPNPSSANFLVNWSYNILNVIVSAMILLFTTWGTVRILRRDKEFGLLHIFIVLPMWFMGETIYTLANNLGRQFLLASLTMIGFEQWFTLRSTRSRLLFIILLVGMLLLSFLWILMYTKFFN